jgi:hypothetical protein
MRNVVGEKQVWDAVGGKEVKGLRRAWDLLVRDNESAVDVDDKGNWLRFFLGLAAFALIFLEFHVFSDNHLIIKRKLIKIKSNKKSKTIVEINEF